MPRRVNQQPPPDKARLVLNIDFGQVALLFLGAGQLLQRGQRPQYAQAGWGVDAHAHWCHAQAVALLVELLEVAQAAVADLEYQAGGRLGRALQARESAAHGGPHHGVGRGIELQFQRCFQAQAALAPVHFGGQRQEILGGGGAS